MRRVALYIHIPFCVHKCGYCDFNSYAGSRNTEQASYLAALEREMQDRAALLDAIGPCVVPTVFVGGGTPTVLDGAKLARVLCRARALFPLAPDAEVTIEANPGTVDMEGDKLTLARQAGANRISIGVQAFQDHVLKRLDRVHTAAEAFAAVAAARAAGFANLNLDLMYGLPGQTVADFRATLEQAIALGPQHISAYSLIIEPETPFHHRYHAGRLTLPDEADEDAMDQLAGELLAAAGYARYEISNYARNGYRCRHNLVYWLNEEYVGVGAGAHSHLDGRRSWNVRLPQVYVRRLAVGASPEEGSEAIDRAGQMAETMILGLRTSDGVNEERFRQRFGQGLRSVYGPVGDRLEAQGLLDRSGGAWRLTARGRRLGNRVWQEFVP